MATPKRGRIFVEPKTQGALLVRVLAYWVCCVVAIGLMMLFATFATRRHIDVPVVFSQTLLQFAPSLIAATLLLPVLMFDSVRLSNRFAGPVLRLRREWSELAKGNDAAAVDFRDNDFWADLADNFNRLRSHVIDLRSECESLKEALIEKEAVQEEAVQEEAVQEEAVAGTTPEEEAGDASQYNDTTPFDPSLAEKANRHGAPRESRSDQEVTPV